MVHSKRHCVASGAASGTAELLPSPGGSWNWTIGLPTDNGHDSDQVFEFNGTQAVRVPDGIVSVNPKGSCAAYVFLKQSWPRAPEQLRLENMPTFFPPSSGEIILFFFHFLVLYDFIIRKEQIFFEHLLCI